jgi:hypothetical protein
MRLNRRWIRLRCLWAPALKATSSLRMMQGGVFAQATRSEKAARMASAS